VNDRTVTDSRRERAELQVVRLALVADLDRGDVAHDRAHVLGREDVHVAPVEEADGGDDTTRRERRERDDAARGVVFGEVSTDVERNAQAKAETALLVVRRRAEARGRTFARLTLGQRRPFDGAMRPE
jgi:hypothetical protein